MKRFLAEVRAGMSTTPKEWAFDIALSVAFVAFFTLNMWPSAQDESAPEHALLIAAAAASALLVVAWPLMWSARARFEAAVAVAQTSRSDDEEGPAS